MAAGGLGAATIARATREMFKHAGIGTVMGFFFGGIWHFTVTAPEKKKMQEYFAAIPIEMPGEVDMSGYDAEEFEKFS